MAADTVVTVDLDLGGVLMLETKLAL